MFREAVIYAKTRKDTLMIYLENENCSFSNNLSENVIRSFMVGRKDGLFSAAPNDIYKYLTYLLIVQAEICQMNNLKFWCRGAKRLKLFVKTKM